MAAGRKAWGTGSIRERGKGTNVWILQTSHRTDPLNDNKRVRVTKTFRGTRRAAEKELAKLVEQPHAAPAKARSVTLDAWLQEQIKNGLSGKTGQRRSDKTQQDMLDLWKRFSTPQLRGTPLREVSTSLLEKHVGELQQRPNEHTGAPLAPRTVQIYFNVLKAVLTAAVRAKVLPLNPAAGIAVKGGSTGSKASQALTDDEMKRFLEADPDHRLNAVWWVSAYTGARPGEVLALRWEDWDRVNGTLHIRRSLEQGKGRRFVPCKAGSERAVPVPDALRRVLLDHQLRQNGERAKIGEDRWVDSGLMFTTEIGSVLEHHNMTRLFRTRLKAAKVRQVRWYDLRHSVGTKLVKRGVDIKTVATLMGHKKVTMTLEHYVHSDTEQQAAAVAKLEWASGG